MFWQIFLSPQKKQQVIITYNRDIYELPPGVASELRLRILGNQKISRKCLNFKNDSLVPSVYVKMKVLLVLVGKS